MLRALLRLIIVLVIVAAAAMYLLGYWGTGPRGMAGATGTAGRIDTGQARAAGAKVGEKTAEVANEAGAALAEGALTAKIKSKMALDDLVQARTIDVTTSGHVVTLGGTVRSAAERERALRIANETAGVTQVVDRLRVGGA